MGLEKGDSVTAVVKATEVMISKSWRGLRLGKAILRSGCGVPQRSPCRRSARTQ